MKNLIFSFLCCLLTTIATSQNTSKMSLEQLDSMIDLSLSQGKYNEMLAYGEQKLEKSKASGVDSLYAFSLSDLGDLYQMLGMYQDAEELYLESVDVHKKAFGTEHVEYANAVTLLAKLYRTIGPLESAEPLFLEVIDITKKIYGENHVEYAAALNNLGGVYLYMQRNKEAEQLYLKSKKIRKQTLGEQHNDYAASLSNLALVYRAMGRYEEAEPLMLQATEIRKITLGEDNPVFANMLNNLASLYASMGKKENAEPLFFQALEIRKKTLPENHPDYNAALNNLASIYREIGKYKEAEPLYLKALELRLKSLGENHIDIAQNLSNLAALYLKMRDYKNAELYFLKAKNNFERTIGEQHPNYAQFLIELSSMYLEQERFELAEPILLKTAAIYKNSFGIHHPMYHISLNGLADLYLQLDSLEIAQQYAFQAILANCKDQTIDQKRLKNELLFLSEKEFYSNYIVASLNILHQISYVYYDSLTNRETLKYGYSALQAAMEINEKIRTSYSGDEDKLRVLQDLGSLAKAAIYTGLELSKNDDKSYLENSFSYAELNKSMLLADAVKGQQAYSLGDLPDSLMDYETSLHTRKKQLEKAALEAKEPAAQSAVKSQQNELNLEIERFLVSIKGKYPKYHALKYASLCAKAKDVQALLDEESLFLEYFVADSVIFIFALTKTDIDLISVRVSKNRLAEKISNLRDALTNYKNLVKNPNQAYEKYTTAAFWFYDNLVAPALKVSVFGEEKKSSNLLKNIFVVADGELGHLPFEAFLTKSENQKGALYNKLSYLVNDYNISYNYSATLFVENKQNPSNSIKKNNSELLAFAPDYMLKSDSLRALHLQKTRGGLIPLPAAQKEIEGLSKIFKGAFKQGKEANETYFKNNAQNYGIIHLAMHGLLNQRAPILSSLAFTEDNDSIEDNFLESWEIARLKLNADLVVLSACETGYGKFEQGEGVISLARSFMYAGVPSLVVSLWQVNDFSTAEIMTTFYNNLAQGMPKDVALRQAKLNYINSAQDFAAHPAFWSAFIQLGDNSPIIIQQKSTWFWWIIGGAGLVLALGLVVIKTQKKAEV